MPWPKIFPVVQDGFTQSPEEQYSQPHSFLTSLTHEASHVACAHLQEASRVSLSVLYNPPPPSRPCLGAAARLSPAKGSCHPPRGPLTVAATVCTICAACSGHWALETDERPPTILAHVALCLPVSTASTARRARAKLVRAAGTACCSQLRAIVARPWRGTSEDAPASAVDRAHLVAAQSLVENHHLIHAPVEATVVWVAANPQVPATILHRAAGLDAAHLHRLPWRTSR
eukprot:CAMPEP_0181191570 /NCGR_PEP_ID=MMETSP1096-20121128/12805_1 /TAXON_ID=156174 ORGANISM="Chrysochromulina ericina, Strain CCMP281" /NCGR_SAMPLE_ID=MMETSP1096 /ASSEMBLY_ACC=CAM_ASM_000453 /LENGTH=229 /DNA_ID=CAMNT_0023280877 /DNA_START=406 /DNA_END=1094 /DNA_ORIENTATION=+